MVAAIIGFAVAVNAQTLVTEFAGDQTMFPVPADFTNNGYTHIARCYYEGNSSLFNITFYENDFTTQLLQFNGSLDLDGLLYGYYDLTNLQYSYDGLPLIFTQNLFNADDNYEYIEVFETGWNIKSTNGAVVQAIDTEEGFWTMDGGGIMKIDDVYYLLLTQRNETERKAQIYRIDQTTGITKVDVELPIFVFPTMADRSQQITVELGEGNNAKEITVVNSSGQVVKRVPMEEGQREITISARELGTGLNVVNTRTEQGSGSCKIIVR